MSVSKPDWLSNFLLSINFQVFTWTLNIGDWIELAIDWVLTPINSALDWGISAYQWGQYLYSRINNLVSELYSYTSQLTQPIWNWIETIWSQIDTWWLARRQEIQSIIDIIYIYINNRIIDIQSLINVLDVKFDSFRSAISSSLTEIKDDLISAKNSIVSLFQQVQFVIPFKSDIVEFFGDPPAWFIKHLGEILEKMW